MKYTTYNTSAIKDKNGRLTTTEKGQEERYTEHFKVLFNIPTLEEVADIPLAG